MGKVVKYVVRLCAEERASLEALVKTGKGAADKRLRAQILLKSAKGGLGGRMRESPTRSRSVSRPCIGCGSASWKRGGTRSSSASRVRSHGR